MKQGETAKYVCECNEAKKHSPDLPYERTHGTDDYAETVRLAIYGDVKYLQNFVDINKHRFADHLRAVAVVDQYLRNWHEIQNAWHSERLRYPDKCYSTEFVIKKSELNSIEWPDPMLKFEEVQ